MATLLALRYVSRRVAVAMVISLTATVGALGQDTAKPDELGPKVGDRAQEFGLKAIDGEEVKLTGLLEKGPVVLVVLRGYTGYQCPACSAQVGDFLGKAAAFQKANASLVFVYPGPAKGLEGKAEEFIRGKTLPPNVYLLLDPAFKFTNAYGLRWDEPKETAYPSTFIIDRQQKIQFKKLSITHGDRAKANDVLKAVEKLGPES